METVKQTIGDAFSRGLEEFSGALRPSSEAVHDAVGLAEQLDALLAGVRPKLAV